MKKNVFVAFGLALLLAGCNNGNTGKAYDPYKDRYEDGTEIRNVYKGGKQDFHLKSFMSSKGGVLTVTTRNNETSVTYNKGYDDSYANAYTSVVGRFSDFTYINVTIKGELGCPISLRAWYDDSDNYASCIFGGDTYINVIDEYKTYSLKVKKTLQTRMDLLCAVGLFPEVGQAAAGTFSFTDVWFSQTMPEGAEWANEGVDEGGDSIKVNGWETFQWTGYNIYPLGPNETAVRYTGASEYGNIQYYLTAQEEAAVLGQDNTVRFKFKDVKDALDRPTISTITFKLVADISGEGYTVEGYHYYTYYESTLFTYLQADHYDPDENGYTTLEIPLASAIANIGNHHKDGYRFSMLVESDPGYVETYMFEPDGEMTFKKLEFFHTEQSVDLWSVTEAGTYTLTDKTGVEKNVTYTNVLGNKYWPRITRLVNNATHDSVITVTIKNNGTETVKVAAHAGVDDDTRSDGPNNGFFPLWKNRGKQGSYFDDGDTKDVEGGATITFEITVDAAFPDDVIEKIQLLFDTTWGDTNTRSGDVDIVSVTVA